VQRLPSDEGLELAAIELPELTQAIEGRRAVRPDTSVRQFERDLAIVKDRAVELLCNERPELAAALFEAVAVGAPIEFVDELKSDRGFCLIPVDALAAIDLISDVVGSDGASVLRHYNLAVAFARAGDLRQAGEHAALAANASDIAAPQQAFIWTGSSDGGLSLVEGDPCAYARGLVNQLSGGD
jgi:hypothetical protein